jgi:hypothetical protein
MKNIFKPLAIIVFTTITIFIGCKKDKDTIPTPEPIPTETPVNSSKLSLKMSPYIGSSELKFLSPITTDNNYKITISMFRYYVSNIRLIKNDGTEYPISDKYLLVTPSTENYDLGDVPVGDYKGLKFNVGIDSVTNHQDPTIYPTTNPLAIQSPGMHWSWSSGYIFMMIEGSVDTTASNTGVIASKKYDRGMIFHIGMDQFYKEIDLSNSAFTVSSSSAKTINIKSDLNAFFTNMNLKLNSENQTHTMNNMPLATKAANNIATMFTVVP